MVCGVIGHVDIHVQVGELFVSFISVALRSGTFGRSCQAQFGQFGLLLLKTLFAPLNAAVLEPDFDLKTKMKSMRNNAVTRICKCVPESERVARLTFDHRYFLT